MKMAILGASVSAQTKNRTTGEITGYAEVFRQSHQAGLGITEVRQMTYSGNRFSDGGLVKLHEVLQFAPDICLFEPLIEDGTRGVPTREGEFLYAYRRLLNAGILPVTLLLPNPQKADAFACPNNAVIRKICSTLGLPQIEISLENVNIAAGFRGIHTRLPGAELYARQIAEGLPPYLAQTPRRALVTQAAQRAKAQATHTFMQKTDMPPDLPKQISGLRFFLNPTDGDTRVRLVQRHQIGPFSPVLHTRAIPQDPALDPISQVTSVWDKYCHYPRDSFVVLANLALHWAGPHVLEMSCSAENPDYETCRKPLDQPPLPNQRHLRPKGAVFAISNKPIDLRLAGYKPQSGASWVSETQV